MFLCVSSRLRRVSRFRLSSKRTVVHHSLREEFEGYVALQFFIARQPDNSHPALAQNPYHRVAAENFLTTGKLPLSGLHCGAGGIIAHLLIVITAKTEIK